LKAEKIFQIKLPVKNITKCCFGGPKMNELFITTARKGMSKKEIIKLPFSGSLFRVKINLKGKSIKSFNSDMLNC
jgi:sugar lactone lactonase YvrE